MNIDKKIMRDMDSGVNAIIARFLIAVFGACLVVTVLTCTGVFLTTLSQTFTLMLAATPSAIYGLLVLCLKRMRNDGMTKYILCALMCLQAYAVAMAAYSYVGTVVLLLPILLAALYPRSGMYPVVSAVMIACGLIIPPLALVTGFWDGEYLEFLYDLSYGRQMDTATLSNEMLSRKEQIILAIRFCSTQNALVTVGFTVVAGRIYKQANKSFDSQRDVIRLSETDVLTGLLNRNSFERKVSEAEASGVCNLSCFYFDVNGLHEMNNKKGHKTGDQMLQFVGKQIQDAFGKDNSFRIGGDEYVAFSDDQDPESLAATKERLEKIFAGQDYHVAIGHVACAEVGDVNELVRQAEAEMYR